MSLELVLYSTDHCTLCDEALEMLFSMPELAGQTVRVIDVATDATLLDAYGPRLPVLVLCDPCKEESGRAREFDWPFDQAVLLAALGQVP